MKIPVLFDLLAVLVTGSCVALSSGLFFFLLVHERAGGKPKSRDLRKLEIQLPPFLDSISSGLAAGNSLHQSMENAVRSNGTSINLFFAAILIRAKSGMTLDASLELSARDLPGSSLSLALLSMASSHRSGSNTIESLAMLSSLCRERDSLRKKIMARTAQGRTQGYVIILIPILFMILLFVLSPQNMLPVITTTTGRALLGTAAVLQGLGAVAINAMVKQEII